MPEHQQTQQSKITDNTSQKQTITPKQIPTSHPAAIIQRARINPKSLTPADVLQLQRTIGNRAVGRLLSEIGLIPSRAKQTPPVQMQTIPKEEEEPLQGKMIGTIQRQEPEEKDKLQIKSVMQRQEITEEEEPLQTKRENNTGMPDNIKAGVENLSGIDMSDVKVHYNSDKPAEVGALAYTQGTDIHVAPGQEKHLPHEAWHVVQQAQGRVKPTIQMKDIAVNDDEGLEQEAEIIGEKAILWKEDDKNALQKFSITKKNDYGIELGVKQTSNNKSVIQCMFAVEIVHRQGTTPGRYIIDDVIIGDRPPQPQKPRGVEGNVNHITALALYEQSVIFAVKGKELGQAFAVLKAPPFSQLTDIVDPGTPMEQLDFIRRGIRDYLTHISADANNVWVGISEIAPSTQGQGIATAISNIGKILHPPAVAAPPAAAPPAAGPAYNLRPRDQISHNLNENLHSLLTLSFDPPIQDEGKVTKANFDAYSHKHINIFNQFVTALFGGEYVLDFDGAKKYLGSYLKSTLRYTISKK